MDLNDYWQDNKRFVTTVACGVVGFLIGMMVLNSVYADDIKTSSSQVTTLKNNLKKAMFTAQDMSTAQDENDKLREAVTELAAAAQFQTRDEFKLDPSLGSASNQYLRALTNVRDDLIPLANRNNLAIDQGLGMPKLSPTRDAEIERYLEALDVIDSVVRLSIEARIQRIEKIGITLDKGLNTRDGIGRIERTRIKFDMRGASIGMTRLLARSQRPSDGRVLHIDDVVMEPARHKDDEVRMIVTFVIARLSEPDA